MTRLFSSSHLLAFALILATTTLSAHGRMAQRLRLIDSNHDRAISLTEALNARQARFLTLDLNHDGVLSATELQSPRAGKRAAARMTRLDKNADRNVSHSEWDAQVGNLFARVDANNDHIITGTELRTLRQENSRKRR